MLNAEYPPIQAPVMMIDDRDARAMVRDALSATVARWGSGLPRGVTDPTRISGLARVDAVLAAIAEALAAFGEKAPDPTGVRAYLHGVRDTLSKARAAFVSVGEDCDGGAVEPLVEALAAVGEEIADAQQALAVCPAEAKALRAANEALQLANFRARDVSIEISKVVAACLFPQLPPLVEAVAKAKHDAHAVKALLSVGQEARALELALHQGGELQRASETSPGRERLEVLRLAHKLAPAYENGHAAFEWRRRRHAETAGA